MSNHYLVHLPHCGTKIPEKYIGDYYLSKEELQNNVYQYADLFTDELFDGMYQQFGGVKNSYSRLLFDPERFFDDKEELMQQKYKLGWFYENAILENKALRSLKHKDEISKIFIAHHEELNKKTKDKLGQYGKCTVIDCHSFSNERYWFHDKNLKLPDICIGFEEEHKDEFLIEAILEEFKEYDIGINEPYQGSLVPTDYYKKNTNVKSVMIEINKRLYLEDDNRTKSKYFSAIKEKIALLRNI